MLKTGMPAAWKTPSWIADVKELARRTTGIISSEIKVGRGMSSR